MPRKARCQVATAQKVAILRRHFVDKVAICDLGPRIRALTACLLTDSHTVAEPGL